MSNDFFLQSVVVSRDLSLEEAKRWCSYYINRRVRPKVHDGFYVFKNIPRGYFTDLQEKPINDSVILVYGKYHGTDSSSEPRGEPKAS